MLLKNKPRDDRYISRRIQELGGGGKVDLAGVSAGGRGGWKEANCVGL